MTPFRLHYRVRNTDINTSEALNLHASGTNSIRVTLIAHLNSSISRVISLAQFKVTHFSRLAVYIHRLHILYSSTFEQNINRGCCTYQSALRL